MTEPRVSIEPVPDAQAAFLLTRQWRDSARGLLLDLWWASDQGPINTQILGQEIVFFVRQCDNAAVRAALAPLVYRCAKVDLKTFNNEPVEALYFTSGRASREAQRQLDSAALSYWEADVRPPERFLMERFITASASIAPSVSASLADSATATARAAPSDRAPPITRLINPQLTPLDHHAYRPQLRALSLDIETSMDGKTLYSIALLGLGAREVWMVAPAAGAAIPPAPDADFSLHWVADSAACIRALCTRVAALDPDLLIGWNLVQFDLWALEQMARDAKVGLTLGRDHTPGVWRQEEGEAGRRFVVFPGRVALDGIELLKAANHRFDSYGLDYVAQQLLGARKLLEGGDGGAAITRLYREDPWALAAYNLQDTQLVVDIFAHCTLIEFALARSQLTGLLLDRIGGSVAAFEYLYLPRLHRRGYIAPNLGERQIDIFSPGGYVMNSRPGLYDNVLVLDFKSLYPSIMRTFLIDPCGFWQAEHLALPDEVCVPGYNGARFARDGHVLPEVVSQLSAERERAKRAADADLSHAIKIIMNSFYGVLGSPGCRFCDPRVSSSITLRGHDIIQASKDWIETQGYAVIYGDTDSLFVWLENNCQAHPPKTPAQCAAIGARLARELNLWWSTQLREQYALTSHLEIQFETHYQRFLMPTIRGSELGTKKRYAGMVVQGDTREIVFKGLESVRTDWTALAKQVQETLYRKVFEGEAYAAWLREQVRGLYAGERDADLVYRKRLRRPLADYVKNVPPQVQAARKWRDLTGHQARSGEWISYVITVNGPEPVGQFAIDLAYLQSPIDYDHYRSKQVAPVVDSILQFVQSSLEEQVAAQLSLFE